VSTPLSTSFISGAIERSHSSDDQVRFAAICSGRSGTFDETMPSGISGGSRISPSRQIFVGASTVSTIARYPTAAARSIMSRVTPSSVNQ
jgi:hypothetical protein